MTLVDMIISYRLNHKMSQRQFAVKCGLSNGYIAMLEKGENPQTKAPINPSIIALKKIATGMGMSLNALLDEAEDMDVDIGEYVESNRDDIFSYPNIEPLPKTYKVPLLGSIRCGTPTDCPEVYDGEVEVPDNVKADYALRCRGDSMINARIFDGDIVYIRRQPTVDSGQIAAVLVDGEATLKRVLFFPDHVTLQAENPTFKPITLWEEQMQELHVLGLAVAFTSRVI